MKEGRGNGVRMQHRVDNIKGKEPYRRFTWAKCLWRIPAGLSAHSTDRLTSSHGNITDLLSGQLVGCLATNKLPRLRKTLV